MIITTFVRIFTMPLKPFGQFFRFVFLQVKAIHVSKHYLPTFQQSPFNQKNGLYTFLI